MADHFLGEYNETRREALSNGQKMIIFMRYLSDSDFQSGIAEDVDIHQSTVSITFSQVLDTVIRKVDL